MTKWDAAFYLNLALQPQLYTSKIHHDNNDSNDNYNRYDSVNSEQLHAFLPSFTTNCKLFDTLRYHTIPILG
jgi:hypothetical protein